MSIKKKIKKIVFRNYFKNPDIVFLFLMICISLMILVFFNDFKKVSEGERNYFNYKYEPPEFIEDNGYLDYSKNGYYPGHQTFIKMIFYFTYQSNLFVLIVYVLFFTKARNQDWYPYLVFVCLISILATGIIYHIVIDKFQHFKTFKWELSYIISHLQHTFVPLIYLYFYFFVNTFAIPYKRMWMGWLHALVYMFCFSLYSRLSMNSYYKKFKKDKPIVESQEEANERDPFKIFPYYFFSPFRPDKKKEYESLGKKRYRFLYKGYGIVFKLFLLLFLFISLMTYFLLWFKKRMIHKKQKKATIIFYFG
ncbi:putative membrane protein [Candidatus Phytoplasma solani]|uniref:hypothetical protein n=1 Tax=Candidatus Phytoplasma solani TaxID=69896 RepID=UPI0032DB1D6B